MDKQQPSSPYRPLGKHLKMLRDQAKESLAEASGAVEIDVKQLASYELGQTRPSEDVLLLLISHFGAKDEIALKIWELAGYGSVELPVVQMANNQIRIEQLSQAQSNTVLFTDIVDVTVNNYGVVMNFMQGAGPNSKPSSVARVGMSREHAKSVLQILQVTLAQTERGVPRLPKQIITPENPEDKKN